MHKFMWKIFRTISEKYYGLSKSSPEIHMSLVRGRRSIWSTKSRRATQAAVSLLRDPFTLLISRTCLGHFKGPVIS